MRTFCLISFALALLGLVTHARSAATAPATDDLIALERAALDRWGQGDPKGFLETYAPEVTYFDPGVEHRIDGLPAITDYYRPFTGKIHIATYDMIDPKVQRHGDVAVLTYNLRSDTIRPDGKHVAIRWNSSSVYARIGRRWKMIHSHWSLTAPPCVKGMM